jgi:hypothetical protein
MRIIDEIHEEIFRTDSDFLPKLASEWEHINGYFFDNYGNKDPQRSFFTILTEEMHRKMPNHKIITSIKMSKKLEASHEEIEKIL